MTSSFDNIYKKVGPIPEDVLGQIALAMVSGLTYLYDVHRIIHRGQSSFIHACFDVLAIRRS